MADIGKINKRTTIKLNAEYLELVIDLLRIKAGNREDVLKIVDGLESTARFIATRSKEANRG